MASRNKKFDFGTGNYYFEIKNSGIASITIKRKEKKDAVYTFMNYQRVGKNVNWLGKWDGKKFIEDKDPSASN